MGVARSGIGWLVAKFGALILSFGSLLYFTRALPNATRVLGLFQVFEAIVTMTVVVFSSGLSVAVTKRISERQKESAFVGAAAAITLGILAILTVGVLVATDRIVSYFEMGLVVVPFLLVTLWAEQISNMGKAVLRGASRVGQTGGVSFAEMAVRVPVQIGLVYAGYELFGLIVGVTLGVVASAAVAVALVPYSVSMPSRDEFESLFSFTKYSYLQGFASKVYMNVDTFVIAALLSSQSVALYNVPFRLAIVLDTFALSISSTVLPEISHKDAMENPERVREVLRDAIVFSTILALPAVVGVAILARPLIRTLFTAEFTAGATVAVLAMAIQVPESLRTVLTSVVMGIDRPDVSLRANLLLVAINVVLDVALVFTIGIEGAAIATFLGAAVTALYLGSKLFGVLDLGWGFFPVQPLAAQVVAAGTMGLIVATLRGVLTFATVPKLALLVSAGVVSYWTILLGISPSTRKMTWGIAQDLLPSP